MPELRVSPKLANFLRKASWEITQNFALILPRLIALIFIMLLFSPSFLAVKGLRDSPENKASVSVAFVLSALFVCL